MAATDWDSLRRNVRNLENELDQRISAYSKLATQLSTAYYSSQVSSTLSAARADANKLELEISEMLDKLVKLVDDMTMSLDSRGTASTSAMGHTLTRHREILRDYQRDFKRTQTQVRDAEQRQTLLGSVRDEISAFKAGTGEDPSDMLLAERSRIDSSHRMTDQVLEQAYATRHEFSQQRSAITGINTRMKGAMTRIPGINKVLGNINSRRRRETLILSAVTAVCSLILLWYVFR